MEVRERDIEVTGLGVHLREAGDRSILYLHGAPTASWEWLPFLERTGGVAPDLPGFGRSAKPAEFDYSIAGYDRFVEEMTAALGWERLSLVVHDWGAVGLAFAQRFPERIERLVLFSTVPFLPGYSWHRLARLWRTRGAGELAMGFSTRWAFRRSLPREIADRAWEDFDQGTQRALLRLLRSAPPEVLARAGEKLGELRCPALVLWPKQDPYIGERFGPAYAEALGGPVALVLSDAGHWSWLDRPELIHRATSFLEAPPR